MKTKPERSKFHVALADSDRRRGKVKMPEPRVEPRPRGDDGDDDDKPPKHHLDKRAETLSAVDATADDNELVDTKTVARWLGVTSQWLSIGRSKKYGPEFIRVSKRRIIYRRGAVREWLKERTYASTKDYPKNLA